MEVLLKNGVYGCDTIKYHHVAAAAKTSVKKRKKKGVVKYRREHSKVQRSLELSRADLFSSYEKQAAPRFLRALHTHGSVGRHALVRRNFS